MHHLLHFESAEWSRRWDPCDRWTWMLRILPLGGLGEVGMNCMAIVDGRDAIVIDCGVTFENAALGVDVAHPRWDALESADFEVRALVLTHGHEDHVGAVPYFLRRFDVPIYGPRYALALLRERAREHEVLGHARLFETKGREAFRLGAMRIEPIDVTHSIADATALGIETSAGRIVHSGDFKFDETPVVGAGFDTERLADWGREGVSLLLSDSTNVDAAGHSGSESDVRAALERAVTGAEGAVIVAMFASNAHRMKLLGEVARATRRRLVLVGRSMETHTRLARDVGILTWPTDLTWPAARVRELPRQNILAVVTGSQGEPEAALARIAAGTHPVMAAQKGDRIVFSSRVIPGHELEVGALVDSFLRRGIDVVTRERAPGIHVSGHACREEQARLIGLTEPEAFVPLHGTLRHLHAHAELARDAGVGSVCVLENGLAGSLAAGVVRREEAFASGRVRLADGMEITPEMLRDRRALGEHGALFVTLTEDDGLSLSTRGLTDEPRVLEAARAEIRRALAALPPGASNAERSEAARLAGRRAYLRATGSKPETQVHVSAVRKR